MQAAGAAAAAAAALAHVPNTRHGPIAILPTELITKIARYAYPNGGQKALALGLTQRHLYHIVRPIVWASLVVPTRADDVLDFVGMLAKARTTPGVLGRTTTSIRYNLPTTQHLAVALALRDHAPLRRLHLVGKAGDDVEPEPEYGLLRDPSLHAGHDDGDEADPVVKDKDVGFVSSSWQNLTSLHLERLDLGKCWDITEWAGQLTTLGIHECLDPSRPLFKGPGTDQRLIDGHPTLQNLIITGCTYELRDIISTSLQALTTTVNFTWYGELLESGFDTFDSTGVRNALAERTTPFSVTVKDATEFFRKPAEVPDFLEVALETLNTVGKGQLHRLTLPVFRAFHARWISWREYFILPNLTELMLDVAPPKNGGVGSRDFLAMVHDWTVDESPNYKQLTIFLENASLPKLSTLRLRGWVDGTGAATVGLTPAPPPAPAPPVPRHTRNYTGSNPPAGYVPAAESPLVQSLLNVLRRMHVSELRLENSRGHPEGDFGCIFSYQATTGTWNSRVVRLWY